MFFFRILNANPDDGVAVVLCLITIWWCVRYVPRGPGPDAVRSGGFRSVKCLPGNENAGRHDLGLVSRSRDPA
jgi:hypothetical protein